VGGSKQPAIRKRTNKSYHVDETYIKVKGKTSICTGLPNFSPPSQLCSVGSKLRNETILSLFPFFATGPSIDDLQHARKEQLEFDNYPSREERFSIAHCLRVIAGLLIR
jgi:hypothetical protein